MPVNEKWPQKKKEKKREKNFNETSQPGDVIGIAGATVEPV